MNRRRNFLISAILVCAAGFFSHQAWLRYEHAISVPIMIFAGVLFMAGIIIFAINFRE